MRAFRFSCELVKLGHRVLLATGEPQASPLPIRLALGLSPTLLEVAAPPITREYAGPVRRFLTAAHLVRDGGWNYAWGRAVVDSVAKRHSYAPFDVIWVSFGKMEAVIAARRLSRRLRVPWVLDVKDNWNSFVPRGLRHLMARRTNGWSALTANSEFFAESALRWQGEKPEVIYSGVDEAFFRAVERPLPKDRLRVTLVGGIYFQTSLELLLTGLTAWCVQRSTPVQVQYAGGDQARFDDCARRFPQLDTSALGYLPIDKMAEACAASHLNAYISHPGTFHHKLLELVTVGRPILVCPSDNEESQRLVRQARGRLLEGRDVDTIQHALDVAFGQQTTVRVRQETYSWSRQAIHLERVLQQTAKVHP